ncbi:DNA damage-regulated autophagy modulator protein 2-like [Macrobrachium nipponense]|uniref:DNA damage-regulated autophagy modulator protein 2-like n=1 Tax=Macrobrachium nipponense TaxID=159736 RepID=UPI0030C7A414
MDFDTTFTMGSSYLYLLPLSVFVLFPSTFIITYTLSVCSTIPNLIFHTSVTLVLILPESCIFGQALNIGALVILVTIYVRYRQIAELYHNHSSSSHIVRLNRIGLFVGSVAALGISVVANFQETNVFYVHITGALMAFGLGTGYLWVQALCSYQTHPLVNSLAMAHVRLSLATVASICFLAGCVCASIAHSQFNDVKVEDKSRNLKGNFKPLGIKEERFKVHEHILRNEIKVVLSHWMAMISLDYLIFIRGKNKGSEVDGKRTEENVENVTFYPV